MFRLTASLGVSWTGMQMLGPSQAPTTLTTIARWVDQARRLWSLLQSPLSFSIPSWPEQNSGWALRLPTTLGITPEPQGSLEILWVSQINNSPHIQRFMQSVHYLNTQSLFSRVCKLKKCWQLNSFYKLSLGWASAGNHLLQFFAMKSLRSQGQVTQSLQHKALLGLLLCFGYVPAKMVSESVKQFPVSVVQKQYPKMTGFLLHQECQCLFSVQ